MKMVSYAANKPSPVHAPMDQAAKRLSIETEVGDWGQPIPDDASFVFIWGWLKPHLDGGPQPFKRNRLIREARAKGIPILCVERGSLADRFEFYYLGWNGLNGEGRWLCGDESDERFRRVFAPRVEVHPWAGRKGPVLLLGQEPGDASLAGCSDYQGWLADIAKTLGDDVWLRPHPQTPNLAIDGVRLAPRGSLREALAASSGSVAWSSTSGVESVLYGTPHMAASRMSMAYDVSSHELGQWVEPDRLTWLYRLAYANWTLAEMADGTALAHMLRCKP